MGSHVGYMEHCLTGPAPLEVGDMTLKNKSGLNLSPGNVSQLKELHANSRSVCSSIQNDDKTSSLIKKKKDA